MTIKNREISEQALVPERGNADNNGCYAETEILSGKILAHWSFRRQIILIFVFGFFLLIAAFSVYQVRTESSYLYRDSTNETTNLAESLAASSRSWVLANDLAGLQEVVNGFQSHPELRYAMVVSPSGEVLAHSNAARVGQFVSDQSSLGSIKLPPENRIIIDDERLSDVAVPIMVDHRHIGWARIAQGRGEITSNLHKMMLSSALFVLIAVFLSLLAALFIANRIGCRIGYLMRVAEAVQAGNYSTRVVNIQNNDDEISKLAKSLNLMLDALGRNDDQLRVTASVFESTQEGILITDADNTIVEINPAFTYITGYSRDEVLNRNPKLLGSGRQDKAFYSVMWDALKSNGAWRGEIWNRRKSGETYAEMLSISVIRDNNGKVLRHVGVFSDISHIKAHEAELSRVAYYDALTGIPNRVMLADRMKQAISQTAREQNMMAICYLDLDGFKPINDTLGHEAGDDILIEIAKRIKNTIRGGDTVARLGGDEFVILLLGLEKGEECVTTLERLLAAIALPITVKNQSAAVSASIGVSIYPLDDEDPDTLLRHADQAMYAAKQAGKNRFYIYDPALDRRARDQHDFLKSIRTGLEQHQFELYYQPKVNLRTGLLVGVEALIRWQHPERGLLVPAQFLRTIENTELDIVIGEWVIATALAQANFWRNTGINLEVSINISGYHLESPRFVERLQQQLAHYPNLPKGQFQIEVLETVALNDIAIVRDIIAACREIGVGFALDDFGTGYSSLSYLRNLPVDVLKIDQSFVRDMLKDKGDMAIVQGIIALAGAFDRQTVAEGIETKEHYQALLDMGCELGQGFGIARPMPANEILHWRMDA